MKHGKTTTDTAKINIFNQCPPPPREGGGQEGAGAGAGREGLLLCRVGQARRAPGDRGGCGRRRRRGRRGRSGRCGLAVFALLPGYYFRRSHHCAAGERGLYIPRRCSCTVVVAHQPGSLHHICRNEAEHAAELLVRSWAPSPTSGWGGGGSNPFWRDEAWWAEARTTLSAVGILAFALLMLSSGKRVAFGLINGFFWLLRCALELHSPLLHCARFQSLCRAQSCPATRRGGKSSRPRAAVAAPESATSSVMRKCALLAAPAASPRLELLRSLPYSTIRAPFPFRWGADDVGSGAKAK